MAQLGRPQMTI